ncbi:MAG: O-antigen ligase family protein, partial [Polyangia bacterium]|nr:O-antigen ligase family protein [Polyangia bacterium]
MPPATSALVAFVVTLVTLAWWSQTDRLDLPKQWVLVATTLLAGLLTWARGRPVAVGPMTLLLLVSPLIALAAAPQEGAARVEGWVGWLAAIALLVLARHASRAALGPPLTALAFGLSIIACLQALGLPIFGGGADGPGGRLVVGTLGGPNHLGWMLAMLLPWACLTLVDRRWWRLTTLLVIPILGALVLTGSRASWLATLLALPFWLPWGRASVSLSQGPMKMARWLWLALVAILGLATAMAVDRAGGRARLGERVADLSAPGGTAAGRLYIWRVHLSAVPDLVGLGSGPESFVRKWPEWQGRYLEKNPDDSHFRSDLRHAHADPVEILADLGVPGFLLGLWLL